MTGANRGMSIAQARALAADPNIAPGVMVRLANAYPETWTVLLSNPSVYPELRGWLNKSIDEAASREALNESETASRRSPTVASVVSRKKTRRLRKRSAGSRRFAAVAFATILVTCVGIATGYVFTIQKEPGMVSTLEIRERPGSPAWRYQPIIGGDNECGQYSISSYGQGKATVLVQNNLADPDCRDSEDPVKSTLALVDLQTGVEQWKIDFESELSWTRDWQKELVDVPGINVILIKFVDVNGQDAADDKAITDDENADRKMKTVVPYNPLNGSVSDAVFAGSDSQPTMQAPVLEILGIPGSPTDVVVMSNGNSEDFRYARYHAKKLSDDLWHRESHLQPVDGNPIVGRALVLGHDEEDDPVALNLETSNFDDWKGSAGGQLLTIGGEYVHVFSECDSTKVSNRSCQGGNAGIDTSLYGVDEQGQTLWTRDSTGFAVSRDDSVRTQITSPWFDHLFILDGEDNHTVSHIDPRTGNSSWSIRVNAASFEISRAGNHVLVPVYLSNSSDSEATEFQVLDTLSGSISASLEISGDNERLDGATALTGFLVDDPDRDEYSDDIESGGTSTAESEDDQSEDETRTCARGIDLVSLRELWVQECNQRQSVVKVGGYWLLVDRTSGAEEFFPLSVEEAAR